MDLIGFVLYQSSYGREKFIKLWKNTEVVANMKENINPWLKFI